MSPRLADSCPDAEGIETKLGTSYKAVPYHLPTVAPMLRGLKLIVL